MTDLTKLDRSRPAAAGQGSRTTRFAQIDRRSAPETTDPKVMAMTKAKPAPQRDLSEAKRAGEGA
ncbi:MAG: hypothetical protein ACFBRM_11695 [Pikeienuella sp.]